MSHILVSHLSKSFGTTHAVNDISLQVEEGEIYGLIGPDGAGKTTTMRLLCGALQPDPHKNQPKTVIQIVGVDMLNQTDPARGMLGYLPQRFSMYEDLTVLENLRFFAEVRGLSAESWKPRCMEILRFVGLAEFIDRRAGHLSGGMRQKLGLAAALVHRPRVLLLDEPTTGVDPVTRQDFWQLIIHLVAQGRVAVLVSTPYMDEAARCTRVGFMRGGRLVVEGTPAELVARLKGQVLELVGQPLTLMRRLSSSDQGVEDSQMFGDRMHLRVRKGQMKDVIKRLKQRIRDEGGELRALRPIQPSLEDVFIALVENNHE